MSYDSTHLHLLLVLPIMHGRRGSAAQQGSRGQQQQMLNRSGRPGRRGEAIVTRSHTASLSKPELLHRFTLLHG